MRYVANKRCRISGKKYLKGETVPSSELAVYEGAKLVRYGILSEIPDEVPNFVYKESEAAEQTKYTVAQTIELPIMSQAGEADSVIFESDDIKTAFVIVQMPVDEAVKEIEQITSRAVYMLLSAMDTRTKSKTALKKLAERFPDEAPIEGESVNKAPEKVSGEDVNGGDE